MLGSAPHSLQLAWDVQVYLDSVEVAAKQRASKPFLLGGSSLPRVRDQQMHAFTTPLRWGPCAWCTHEYLLQQTAWRPSMKMQQPQPLLVTVITKMICNASGEILAM